MQRPPLVMPAAIQPAVARLSMSFRQQLWTLFCPLVIIPAVKFSHNYFENCLRNQCTSLRGLSLK